MSGEVDEAALASLIDAYGPQDAGELVAAYFADAPPLIAAMEAAVAAGGLLPLTQAAHQLKSTSTLVALTGLAALCLRIEKLAEPQAAAPLLAELKQRYAQARAELAPRLAGP